MKLEMSGADGTFADGSVVMSCRRAAIATVPRRRMARATPVGAEDFCFLSSLPGGARTLRQALHRWEKHGGRKVPEFGVRDSGRNASRGA